MNKVILKGRLTRDIEMRTTTTGKSVGTFSLAVDRRFKQDGQPDADFIPCVAWGKTAEVMAQYLSKGRETLVEGRMQIRNYDDKDGYKRYVTEVIIDSFEFCGNKPVSHSEFGTTTGADDIPF